MVLQAVREFSLFILICTVLTYLLPVKDSLFSNLSNVCNIFFVALITESSKMKNKANFFTLFYIQIYILVLMNVCFSSNTVRIVKDMEDP